MVGRLRSVPLTFVGALVLGRGVMRGGLSAERRRSSNVRLAIPTLMLFIVLLLIPEVRLRGGSTVAARMPRLVSGRATVVAGAALIGGAWAFAAVASDATLTDVAPGLALGLIALSMVPLTGWAGQVSLCQMTFAGMGAFAMTKVAPTARSRAARRRPRCRCPSGRWWRSRAPAPRALPRLATLRARCSWTVCSSSAATCSATSGPCASSASRCWGLLRERPRLLRAVGHRVRLCAVGLLALRRGRFGRRLSALRDSQVACTMMGMNTTVTKLQVFALSSAIAAVGGVLLAGLRRSAGTPTTRCSRACRSSCSPSWVASPR